MSKFMNPLDLRRELLDLTLRDLLGPAGGPDEIVTEDRVSGRYVIGALEPKDEAPDDEPIETLTDAVPDSEDGKPPASTPPLPMMRQTAIGLTFSVTPETRALEVTARWGQYKREKSHDILTDKGNPKSVWQRHPREGTVRLMLRPGQLETLIPVPEQPAVFVRGRLRDRGGGARVITLHLVNGQARVETNKDEHMLFQPELEVRAPDSAPAFLERPVPDLGATRDPDDQGLALLYRKTVEFAAGHGVAVDYDLASGRWDRAVAVRTAIAPQMEVERMDPPAPAEIPGLADLVTDMRTLADMPAGGFGLALEPLTRAYGAWIEAQAAELQAASPDLAQYQVEAATHLERARRARERIMAGIRLLDESEVAAKAFRFANRAMADQRVHTLFARAQRQGDPRPLSAFDEPANRSWRPFQLAFFLLNLPSLADPEHPDRSSGPDSIVDLLWFPTGGGKTEAYLAVTAFTIAMRRLAGQAGDAPRGGDGIAVLMRYTLRLLTLQQFQRAAALICACEAIRREDPATWGLTPIRIGLWVGEKSTPNYTSQAEEAIRAAKRDAPPPGTGSPVQLTSCPWCGKTIAPSRDIEVQPTAKDRGRTLQFCSDEAGACLFSRRQAPDEGLPIVVVDEEIYRLLPALVIATVDKFAQMPWRGQVQALFGRVTAYCPRHGYRAADTQDCEGERHMAKGTRLPAVRIEPVPDNLRPPDLIIQDELHLISGPLGTLVGLYETAVDTLCTWKKGDIVVQPKVIASTATIRRAAAQTKALFAREVAVFPPAGLTADDNFFSRRSPSGPASPGRLYVGLCAPGTRVRSFQIRVYTSVLAAAQLLFEKYGEAVDPWMTLVGYYNSLRELGGGRRVVEDSVREQLRRMEERGLARRYFSADGIDELTSRKSAGDIPKILDRLETRFQPKSSGATKPLSKPPYDVVLATNMISVGVDVGRLGLMVVSGQPKATAEYIQATSRVGRDTRGPGLVFTILNWSRPRDLSHYERFRHYHATYYEQVEALSVTPFSRRALDRALTGVLVALVRLQSRRVSENDQAGALTRQDPAILAARQALVARARLLTADPEFMAELEAMIDKRLDEWLALAQLKKDAGAVLGYREAPPNVSNLLRPPPESNLFTAPNSLRGVEPMTSLVLMDHSMAPRSRQEREVTP
jgi:hypothetical protein